MLTASVSAWFSSPSGIITLAGASCVVGLQIYRIQVEERLLRDAFRGSFTDFAARTRFRLIPLLW